MGTPETKTSSPIDLKTEVLRGYRGDMIADIFSTAVVLFPSFRGRFEGVGFRFGNEPGFAYRGLSSMTESEIEMGPPSPDATTQFISNRLAVRFGIPKEVTQNPDIGSHVVWMVSFAHELGHLVQDNNGEMQRFFGTTIPDRVEGEKGDVVADLRQPEAYLKYANSLSEVNADYIGRSILANSQIGMMTGIELPEYEPAQWESWAETVIMRTEDLT
ncbi:MAG: hypothetical protein WAQ57_00290 [Candidatus Saccharimonadales bacterium]